MRSRNPLIGHVVIRAFRIAVLVMSTGLIARADTLEVGVENEQTHEIEWSSISTNRFRIEEQSSDSPGVIFLMTYNRAYLVRSWNGSDPGAIGSITLELSSTTGYVHLEVTQASSVGTINLVSGAPEDVYTSVNHTNITGDLGSA
jgi:hypothetical protein